MAESLDPKCTPLKHKYDACFNTWFEGYLQQLPPGLKETEREQRIKTKNDEYNQKCGKVWEAYRTCVQDAVTEKGLNDLLEQARDEAPLLEPEPPEK